MDEKPKAALRDDSLGVSLPTLLSQLRETPFENNVA
jgi:hypothetical protein